MGGVPMPGGMPDRVESLSRNRKMYGLALVLGLIGGVFGIIGGNGVANMDPADDGGVRRISRLPISPHTLHIVAELGKLEMMFAVVAVGLSLVIGFSHGSRKILASILVGAGVLTFLCTGILAGPLIATAGICGLIGSSQS
jgi:hypothetical protein